MRLAIDELAGGTVRLDEGPELTILGNSPIEPEYEYIRSESAVLPDVRWIGTDASGHTHHWEPTGETDMAGRPRYGIPSAYRSTKHIDCDGSECGGVCEGQGYDVPVWLCRSCDAELEPGYRPDDLARGSGIPRLLTPGGWDLTVDATPAFPAENGTITWTPSAPQWTTVSLTPPNADPIPGRGVMDFSGIELVSGEPLKAVVHFYVAPDG